MTTLRVLVKRNVKLFFKDKGMFLTSLITPAILLVLYVSFLGNVFRDSVAMNLPPDLQLPDKLLDGLVGGQLISSILAVSCVTVSFCANFLMVQDKANGSIRDLRITPVKPSVLAAGYYMATLVSSLIVCLTAVAVCLVYVAAVGWYMTLADVLCLLGDVVLLVLFGTALSSIINVFLSTQGQISAVGTIVSSGYGFICGAYMPISSFGVGLQRALSFLPGTYGTVLMRNHAMRGALSAIADSGVPADAVDALKDGLDCRLYFFDHAVSEPVMYLVLCGTVAVLIAAYVAMHSGKKKV